MGQAVHHVGGVALLRKARLLGGLVCLVLRKSANSFPQNCAAGTLSRACQPVGQAERL
jgi:hypothetical protein